jgi:hypothetical protein
MVALAIGQVAPPQTDPPTRPTTKPPAQQTQPSTQPNAGPAATQPAQPFATPITVKNPERLALTPKLDGKIDAEEWDPFYSQPGLDTYFQWEPRKLHMAAKLPVGQDLVVSLDLKGDGWLVGRNNVEIRATWDGKAATAKVRTLYSSSKSGPAWGESADLQKCVTIAASGDSATWTVEMTLEDPGTGMIDKQRGKQIGVRFDALPSKQVDTAPYLPRVLTPVTLVYHRGSALPAGLRWQPEINGRSVIPGGHIRIRFDFVGDDSLGLKRIEMRSEGVAQDSTTLKSEPFPAFDKKNRAIVDYDTPVSSDAEEGFRIARATIQSGQAEPTVLKVSYEISPAVTFDLNLPKKLGASDKAQKYRFSLYMRSNVSGMLDGTFVVVPPTGWSVEGGSDKEFVIYASRGSVRKAFELNIPAGTKGTFPLKFVADFGRGRVSERSFWISLE